MPEWGCHGSARVSSSVCPPRSMTTPACCTLALTVSSLSTGSRAILSRAGLQRQPARDHAPAVQLVDHVDAVVLAVRARHAEQERQPAPEAELALAAQRAR